MGTMVGECGARFSASTLVMEALLRFLPIVIIAYLLFLYLLFYFVPEYVMPSVDHYYRHNVGYFVQQIVEDSSSDVDKALRIEKWVYRNLVNIHGGRSVDNRIVFLNRPPYICIRLIRDRYSL